MTQHAGKTLCGQLALVVGGSKGVVVATNEIADEIQRAAGAAEHAGRTGRRADRYANGVKLVRGIMANAVGNGFLTVQKSGFLKFEERMPSGQAGVSDVAVYVFKRDQYRAYGGYIPYGDGTDGKRCFVVLHVDEAKKRDKVDRSILEQVGKELARYTMDAKKFPWKQGQAWPVREK